MVVALGWSKGLSTQPSKAKGTATLNLVEGVVRVKVSGLGGGGHDVWLVDNQPSAGGAMPAEGDLMQKVGQLQMNGDVAGLERRLGPGTFSKFNADVVVVTEAGKSNKGKGVPSSGNAKAGDLGKASRHVGGLGVIPIA